ncbi:MAG: RagB/SusD family nutrient uptake outer membrane protein [Sphingobacteriaceae bacterium]|jgi:hypothetical protein|nr:RagB/SusD family nutrient uptake outer membrane protein [Sphingobacteriaceae bacterium]
MKSLKYIFLGLLLVSSQWGCKKFLEENAYSFKTPSNLMQTPEAAQAYLVGVYDRLASTSPTFDASFRRGMLIVANFGTDDFAPKGVSNGIVSDYANYTYTANDAKLPLIWDNFYAGINQADDIIENIGASPLPAETVTRITAEAKFLRALFYFYLVRMHGGVPLVLKPTTDLSNLNTPRATIQAVYEQILKDLNEATPALPEVSGTVPGRGTRGAALALLTKVYLTMASYAKYKTVSGYEWVNVNESFTKAVSTGKLVLAITDYSLVSNYGSIFDSETENGPETIFSVQMEGRSTVSDEGSFLTNLFGPTNIGDINVSRGGQNNARPTRNLVNRYDATDTRKARNIQQLGYNGCTPVVQTVFYCGKFMKPCGYDGQHFSDPNNFPLLRLADVMLEIAEAEAELNNGAATPFALQMVNTLRAKRYSTTPPVPPATNFLNFIFDERSRELCYEGQRWFDLARTGRLIAAVKATVLTAATFTGAANIKPMHYLFPIPQTEIDNNSAIEPSDQNPGY